jgi:hypothetical protein
MAATNDTERAVLFTFSLDDGVTTRLFELEPRTKRVFGLTEETQCTAEFVNAKKLTRGIGIIRMLDGALSMYVRAEGGKKNGCTNNNFFPPLLCRVFCCAHHHIEPLRNNAFFLPRLGPDTDTLVEILDDLGKRHIKYGVKAQYYPYLGQAIMSTLSETLGDKWTKAVADAWHDVYDELAEEMMRSTLLHSSRRGGSIK